MISLLLVIPESTIETGLPEAILQALNDSVKMGSAIFVPKT
jgi:hypothetical protein